MARFDLRLWVLVTTAPGPEPRLRVWLFRPVYARLAARAMSLDSPAHVADRGAHLCNYAVQVRAHARASDPRCVP